MNPNGMHVSVVIPTFNRSRSLVHAVISAATQTRPPEEIVIVDDCSTDDTPQTCRWLIGLRGRVYPQHVEIVYLRLDRNRGANAARNAGWRASRCSRIAFLDSDDVWHPQKLEKQAEALAEAGGAPSVCYTGRVRVGNDGRLIALQVPATTPTPETLRCFNPIGTLSSVMIDRAVLEGVGGFDESLPACQDWDLFVRVAGAAVFIRVPMPLVMYHDGEAGANRITGNPRRRLWAHLMFRRKHMCGSPEPDLRRFYRSVAEDLSALGRLRSAVRFHAASLVAAGYPGWLAQIIAVALRRRIKAARYLRYRAGLAFSRLSPAHRALVRRYQSDYLRLDSEIQRISEESRSSTNTDPIQREVPSDRTPA